MLLQQPILLALSIACIASGQETFPPAFEVSSVKPAAACCAPGQWRESQVGEDRIDLRYVTVRYCLALANRVKEFQVFGPSWINELRFDIVAKATEGTRRPQIPEMVQTLLAERFKLQVHHEVREFDVYVIAVGKKGVALQELPPDPGRAPGAAIGLSVSPAGVGRIEVKHGTIASLAGTLSRIVGRPVVDHTSLAAAYNFDLEYEPQDGASVSISIRKLGLTMEARKLPMDAIVVDRAEKVPTEN